MKKLGTNIKSFVNTICSSLNTSMTSLITKYKNKWRLKGRIRLCNKWAKHHPKKFIVSFILIMILIFSLDMGLTCIYKEKRALVPVTGMIQIQNSIAKVRQMDNRRNQIVNQYNDIIEQGNNLVARLDSINKIQNKTAEDSLNLYLTIEKINIISKMITNEEN